MDGDANPTDAPKTIAVYCGARHALPVYEEAAANFGLLLAAKGFRLIYGGSDAGTMATLANAFLDAGGGYAIGVTCEAVSNHSPINARCQVKYVARNLAERKAYMYGNADAAVALPGAVGTLDEIFDFAARRKFDPPSIRLGILNVNGFYDPLLLLLEKIRNAGFIQRSAHIGMIIHFDPEVLLHKLLDTPPPNAAVAIKLRTT